MLARLMLTHLRTLPQRKAAFDRPSLWIYLWMCLASSYETMRQSTFHVAGKWLLSLSDPIKRKTWQRKCARTNIEVRLGNCFWTSIRKFRIEKHYTRIFVSKSIFNNWISRMQGLDPSRFVKYMGTTKASSGRIAWVANPTNIYSRIETLLSCLLPSCFVWVSLLSHKCHKCFMISNGIWLHSEVHSSWLINSWIHDLTTNDVMFFLGVFLA